MTSDPDTDVDNAATTGVAMYAVTGPATGDLLAGYQTATAAEVDAAVEAAHAAATGCRASV